jgi:CHAD domain-containing protein
VKSLEALQDILGELNDVAVARRLLKNLEFETATTLVRRELAARERRLIASLEPAWTALEKRRPFWKARA